MHIGVCDDRQDARDMIAEKIRSLAEEYQITTYASGEEVLEEAELLDILFLDIRMPGLSGMETARRASGRNAGFPDIVSGHSCRAGGQAFGRAGGGYEAPYYPRGGDL